MNAGDETPSLAASTIVVGVDFTEFGEHVVEQAMQIAARHGAALHLVHVTPEAPAVIMDTMYPRREPPVDLIEDRLIDKAASLISHATLPPPNGAFAHVVAGNVAAEICSLAADLGADLIVLGTHSKRVVRRLLQGSVAEQVVRSAKCPVLIIRPDDHPADVEPISRRSGAESPLRR